MFKLDSGATGHYIRPAEKHALINIQQEPGPQVLLPDGTSLNATFSGNLPIPGLSPIATKGHVFNNLSSASLLSVGRLCDDDCEVLFTKNLVHATKHGNLILEGTRNKQDGLWDINLKQSIHKANIVIQKHTKTSELIEFYQGCLFSPTKSTLLHAAKQGNFIAWRGLTPQNIQKYYKPTIFTAKGHLNQERKNLQSTKLISPTPLSPADEFLNHEDFFPTLETRMSPTTDVLCSIQPFQAKDTGYSDLTGRFPYPSSRGNQYVLVLYDYDSNAILAKPIRNRQSQEIITAFSALHTTLSSQGRSPKYYILDNECSEDLKTTLANNKLKYQLAPPYQHRRNAAERAIQTYKNHFLAGLASTHPDYPIAEWDRLIEQSVITLNLLRNSRINPKLSAYAFLHGNYHFAHTPMLPPGTKILVHEKPIKRASWSPHGVEAWYIAPTTEHYRCVTAFIPTTFRERICDTVEIFPHTIPIPSLTATDYIHNSLDDILTVLTNPPRHTLPFMSTHPTLRDAIAATAAILKRAIIPPSRQRFVAQPLPKPHDILPRVHPIIPSPSLDAVNIYPKSSPIPGPNVHDVSPPRVKKKPSTPILAFPSLPPGDSLNSPIVIPNFQPTPSTFTQKHHMGHIYNAQTGKKETIDSLMTGPDANEWKKALSNEFWQINKWQPTQCQTYAYHGVY